MMTGDYVRWTRKPAYTSVHVYASKKREKDPRKVEQSSDEPNVMKTLPTKYKIAVTK